MKMAYAFLALLMLSGCASTARSLPAPADASDVRVQLERADRALREARLVDAEILYRGLSDHHPRLPEVWLQLGNIYTRQGQFIAAMRAYRDGLKHTPEDGRLWHNLALVELKQAIHTLETASQVIPAESPWRGHIEHLHGSLLHGSAQQARADTGR